jgi:glycerophosphoryl diester phosphodiesterase
MVRFKKIAHRGASGEYPENTRMAFAKAIEARADMIELDCQLTRDGHVVVYHDEKLRRITGARGALRDKTLAQLKTLDIGQWRKKAYMGERILTLEEAIETVAGNVDLCVEIKSFAATPGIELKLLFILSHYDYLDRTMISSFDYRVLDRVRELAPEATIAVIFGSNSKEDPFNAASRLGAVSINVQKELASREFLRRAWDSGLDVYVWTINDLRQMEEFASLGIQGIITDFPEKFWKLNS